MLTFRNVSFRYAKNKPVLQGLSVSFGSGRTLLLGPNGSGKSTTLALAAGLLRPRSGKVDAKVSVSLLPQDIPVFPDLTLEQQVSYTGWLAMKTTRDAAANAINCLDIVGLADRAHEKPKNLSGGQLRRLGIAGMLNTNARVLLLDEPTAGLDVAQAAGFYASLNKLDPDIAVVVSTHQLDGITDYFDRVVVLAGGKIVFDGAISEFVAVGASEIGLSNSNALVNAYAHFVGSSF